LYQRRLINLVEARGVEPLSETVSTRTSPGAAISLRSGLPDHFPPYSAQWQAMHFGSL